MLFLLRPYANLPCLVNLKANACCKFKGCEYNLRKSHLHTASISWYVHNEKICMCRLGDSNSNWVKAASATFPPVYFNMRTLPCQQYNELMLKTNAKWLLLDFLTFSVCHLAEAELMNIGESCIMLLMASAYILQSGPKEHRNLRLTWNAPQSDILYYRYECPVGWLSHLSLLHLSLSVLLFLLWRNLIIWICWFWTWLFPMHYRLVQCLCSGIEGRYA